MDPKTALAFKWLRQRYASIFQSKMKAPGKPLSEAQQSLFELLTQAISARKKEEKAAEEESKMHVTIK